MKRVSFNPKDPKTVKKIEKVLAETVIHRNPFTLASGAWPFVVFGPDKNGKAVIRIGSAEQVKIHTAPVYIATLDGPHIPESDGVPIEELAGDDVPEELLGMNVFHVAPMRPISITTKKIGPPLKNAVSEICDLYKDDRTAIIETPDESYWALSVLKYLDESDRFFPDPIVANFQARLGGYKNSSSKPSSFLH